MEYEAVQRSYVHGNNYNEEYNYSNENNNYVNESEEEPLYNIYDGNEYYYFEQQDKQVKLIYFSVTYFIFMIKQIITFVFNFHIIKYKKYITKNKSYKI